MLHIISRLADLLEQYRMLVLPFGILFSLIICFSGYKYLKVWVTTMGFICGLGAGYIVASRFSVASFYVPLLISVLSGIVLALLAFFVFKAGVFGLVALIVGEMVWNISAMELLSEKVGQMNLPGTLASGMASALPVVLTVLAGVLCGVLAVKMTRTAVILSTGITGAYRTITYLITLLGITVTSETRMIWLGVIVLLALLGIVVQFFTTKKE